LLSPVKSAKWRRGILGAVFKKYLALLGVGVHSPSRSALGELVRAQLTRVPFENVSKLYLMRRRGADYMPSLEEHLEGIESFNFGGTCYANNYYFSLLLGNLGYEVTLCGADMTTPDVHVVSTVRLEGREWLVDVGYAAPFFEPLPLDLDIEYEIRFGSYRYVLMPRDQRGCSRLQMFRAGELVHGYLAKPEPRPIDHFEEVIRDSYRDSATFMNAVVVERFFPGRSVRIHNLKLTESTPDQVASVELSGLEQLVQAVERHCGIPAAVVREAVDGLALEGDIYT
jgi:arylamine N-acetyltransferase